MDTNFKVTLDEYLPLRDVVFNNLRDAITKGELKPGERLLEKQLSEKIGVSRTPIREALRRLETEGFVEMIPRKGAMVAVISRKSIEDVLEIRAVLEALAARLACRNVTNEALTRLDVAREAFEEASRATDIETMSEADIAFHELIFSLSGNPKLVHLINNLSGQIQRFRVVYLKDKSYTNSIISEHIEIIEALTRKDENLAAEIAARHIENQKKAVINAIE